MRITIDVDGKLLALLGVVQQSFTTTPKPPGVSEYEVIPDHVDWKPDPLTVEQALKACARVGASALVHNSVVGVLNRSSLERYKLGGVLGSHGIERRSAITMPGDAGDVDVKNIGVVEASLVD